MVLDIVSSTPTSLRVQGTITGTPTYAIRRHATVGTIFKGGAGMAVGSDTVSLYDETGNVSTSIYNGANWEDSLTGDPTTDSIVYPGQGFVINNGSSPAVSRSVTIGGDEVSYVKTTKTQVPLFVGTTNLVGLVNPLVATAAADPIYNTSGVSPLGAFNFSGTSLTDGSDFIDVLSLDGRLSGVVNAIDNGANVEDSLSGDNLTAFPIRNGTALSVKVFGLPKSATQSVVHPIN